MNHRPNGNIEESLLVTSGIGNDFLAKTPKLPSIEEIIDKLDIIKMKTFCSVKDNVKRMRR